LRDQTVAGRLGLQVQVDSVTALPWLGSIAHDVHTMLRVNGYLALVLLDLKSLADIETECGRAVYNEVIAQICREVVQLRQEAVRSEDLICTVQPFGEEIVLFLEAPRAGKLLTRRQGTLSFGLRADPAQRDDPAGAADLPGD